MTTPADTATAQAADTGGNNRTSGHRAAIDGAVYLPVELLRPSPTNPRKHFDQAALADLADSLKKHTQLQPIVARPIDGAKPGGALYEVVCGERRWRACQLAGLSHVMALLRPMTDIEVIEVQIIENLKRQDLTELEEAQGYAALLRGPTGLQGYATADELAKRIGKSRSYVFQRLKLLDLCEEGRTAMAAGQLPFSIALLVARLPKAEDQRAALEEVLAGWGGGPYTYKDAEELISRRYHLVLGNAPFKIADATLLPDAGPCNTCGKRSGANPDLFADVKRDTCTDATCYRAKEDAHRARIKAEAQDRGIEVITGKDAKKAKPQQHGDLKGYLELDKVHHRLGTQPLRKLLGKPLPEVLLLDDPHTGDPVEVVREAEALQMLRDRGAIKPETVATESAASRDADRAAKAEVAVRKAIAQAITDAAGGNAGAEAAYRQQLLVDVANLLWRLLPSDQEKRVEQLMAWDHIGSDYADKGNSQRKTERISGLDDGAFTRYLTAVVCAGHMYVNAQTVKTSKPAALHSLAERLGVDVKAIREEHRQLQRAAATNAVKPPPGTKGTAAHSSAQQPNPPHRTPAPAAGQPTPETALAAALAKAQAAQAPTPAAGTSTARPGGAAVRYRCPLTLATWTGRGLQPAWLRAALASGKTLADFAVPSTTPAQAAPARSAVTLSPAGANPFRHSADPQ